MSDDNKKSPNDSLSRRKFMASAAFGTGALAVGGMAKADTSLADKCGVDIPSVMISPDFKTSLATPAVTSSFSNKDGMTGAEVFARACKEEELAALFCCPGNYDVVHALAAEGIPSYGGRNEGQMCHAADGFHRATGEVAACSGTEGPGFTSMIMGIGTANAARTPLLVLASNMTIAGEDREQMIQNVYQQPTTEGMKKYGKRIITPNRVHEYAGYAFRQLKSGVPGPVHLDFPSEVSRAKFTDPTQLTDYYNRDHYRTESRASVSSDEIKTVIKMIGQAERPLIIAGQGVFQRKGWEALMSVVERNDIAVAQSGPVNGHFPDDHRLSAATATGATLSADLVIFIGQYCMPSPNEYAVSPGVKMIRVHPEQEDIGRNWPVDYGIVSDEALFLEALANKIPRKKRSKWVNELEGARKKFSEGVDRGYQLAQKYSQKTGHLHPAAVAMELENFFFRGDIDPKQTCHTMGGFTIGRALARNAVSLRPAQSFCVPYQYGAIGADIGMAFGIGVAVQRGIGPQAAYKGAPILCATSDAAAAYGLFEMDTANQYKVPMIVVIYNNNAWGTWGQAYRKPQATHIHLFQENLRYDKMAEGLGVHGEYVKSPKELQAALARAYKLASTEGASSVINCQGLKEFSSASKFPHPSLAWPVEPGRGAVAH
ncbi:thiamine pyrophosphate-binding protein [Aestuariicella hydrocarbonica]|uniref:Thiamine pyrophosphate-binding protein n=1 Tax=Pseudomaricurvus hydrocarbonicus TaxID=1470433 RepID=A0A9E5T3N7_9GAMM|nr:thiamine pyrophosphate-binding protein [Aestuariicella hydrocarbonica]NHO67323.1 thiamine pyrophosphate-binding protein [Aestuariicella hydrocarbonica]